MAALSTALSTAALDKNPQSKERGITLDLGFSSFIVGSLGGAPVGAPCAQLQEVRRELAAQAGGPLEQGGNCRSKHPV